MTRRTINYFMWGYQVNFCHSLQYEANMLFKLLDNSLLPNVFLVGLLVDERDDRHKVCIEPEDTEYSIELFQGFDKLAHELERVDSEKQIFHTHIQAQENHEKRISNKARIKALHKILEQKYLFEDVKRYISYPTYVEGYLVFAIIEFSKKSLNNHYILTKSKFEHRYHISKSFLESTIEVFLEEATNGLKDPNKGISAIETDSEEILRKAAKKFMYTVSSCSGNMEGLHGLYYACNIISSMRYEGAEGLGKLLIAKKDHENIKMTFELKKPIQIQDHRKVRKFLELSNNESIIISDSANIYGLGELVGKYNSKSESLFIINFSRHYKWEVEHDGNLMMIVDYKTPRLPKDRIDRNNFYSDMTRIFQELNHRDLTALWETVIQATEQKHGTMLVITENARTESERLGNQCFELSPLKLHGDLINQITKIDGAVLLDQECNCYAIGVILDGLATDKGTSSRGARYNSAIRYFEQYKSKCRLAIIIISEDGMIDILPKLIPQIEHELITKNIAKLGKVLELTNIQARHYYKYLNWFEKHEFYLTEEECNTINKLRREIEEKVEEESNLIIDRRELKPNIEMNDTYYKKK